VTFLELKLKPLETEQLEQVVELDKLSLGGLWTLEGYQRELASPNSRLLAISIPKVSASQTEKIVGLCCFWAILEEAHITILAVHPDYQGQGFGKLLLCSLLQEAIAMKLERATLEVRELNHVALSLYQKFGFKIAGRRKRYYQKTGEDALILWCGDLNQPEFISNLAMWQKQVSELLRENNWKLIGKNL
jgi:[ribosomal protein S18]-alanine N-acetyltransferase